MNKLKMHSSNLQQDTIAAIKKLLPQYVTESANENGQTNFFVDFDRLRDELSDVIITGGKERYQLNWPGKREALVNANSPIFKTLRPLLQESVNFDSSKNIFIEGDNLDALKLLQETYLGKIKLIYVDPPYNTGSDFIYKDSFAADQVEHELANGDRARDGNRLVANP